MANKEFQIIRKKVIQVSVKVIRYSFLVYLMLRNGNKNCLGIYDPTLLMQ